MKFLSRLPFALVAFLSTTPAFAQDAAASSIGGRLQSMIGELTGPLIFLVSIISLVAGLWLLGRSLIRLKDSGGQGDQTGSALLTIVAAIMLIALPEVAGIGMMTTAGGGFVSSGDMSKARATLDAGYADQSSSLSKNITKITSIEAPENCLGEKDEAVTCMAKNLAQNVVPIGIVTVFAAVFIMGLFGLAGALFDLTKSQGGRGVPEGFWGKIIFNVLLMNGPIFFGIMTNTIFGGSGTISDTGDLNSTALLTYSMGTDSGALKKYEELIGYGFVILALFGAIAFVRGILVMKAAGEGKQGGTYGHGIVFMVAGVLLANAKASTCTILMTVGAGGVKAGSVALGFC